MDSMWMVWRHYSWWARSCAEILRVFLLGVREVRKAFMYRGVVVGGVDVSRFAALQAAARAASRLSRESFDWCERRVRREYSRSAAPTQEAASDMRRSSE